MIKEGNHTTNYTDTFIAVADDCPVKAAEVPPVKNDKKTVASMQFERIMHHPYTYTSDDVIFGQFAEKNGLSGTKAERDDFFSKGQPCLRASPLGKRYGWGVHADAEGKVALYPVESEEYKKLEKDPKLTHTKAMRSKRI